MVRPDTVLESIKTAIEQSDRLPTATTYSIYQIDTDGGQSNLRPPIVELTINDTIRSAPHNTDLVGTATDSAGNHIGRIYQGEFEMPFQIDVWTAEGGDYDPYELGSAVRYALYQYDDTQRGDSLPDPDNPSISIDEVEKFSIGDGGVRNDLSMTPALRRWRQTGEVWFHETINTAEEYGPSPFITDVVTPTSEDMYGDGLTIEFDATDSVESAADIN